MVVAEARESGYKPNASLKLCMVKNTRMEALGWKMRCKSQPADSMTGSGPGSACCTSTHRAKRLSSGRGCGKAGTTHSAASAAS